MPLMARFSAARDDVVGLCGPPCRFRNQADPGFSNDIANRYVQHEYRKGWNL